ncbi:MAG: flagellar biosynthetic protein FliO [Roseomonas sp.]|nr:flagellar biosynthetic protein FliO [Roseomonas sp.]
MQEIGPTSLITVVLALAGVLAVLVLALRGVRAAGLARGGARRLAIQEAVALDGRRRVVLLRCDGRDLLLVTGGGQDTVIGWLPDSPAAGTGA